MRQLVRRGQSELSQQLRQRLLSSNRHIEDAFCGLHERAFLLAVRTCGFCHLLCTPLKTFHSLGSLDQVAGALRIEPLTILLDQRIFRITEPLQPIIFAGNLTFAMNDIHGFWTQKAETPTRQQNVSFTLEVIPDVVPFGDQFDAEKSKTVPDALFSPLFGQPESQDTSARMRTFALLDAAKVPALPEMLEASGLKHCCLFKGVAYDELKDVAPWLVRLEEGNSFTRNLFTRSDAPWHLWDSEPGLYVRSGIPGAGRDEEFSDSFSSRIAWGALNIVFGAAEVIGGVVLTVGTLGWGTVAGGALSIAGFEAITQGIDMWRTPVESSHATGWLGDGAFAMMNEFGVLDENDQASFNRYWSFAMLGLSLGGAGVLGYAGDIAQANRAGMVGRSLDFVAEAPARALATARQAIVGVKNARFGQLTVSYAPLPSGRIAMNIQGVGRVVAPHWESLPRLRLRMNTADARWVEQRTGALGSGRAGLFAFRGGINSSGDAQRLVEEALEASGISTARLNEFVSGVNFVPDAAFSSFNPGTRAITIRGRIGTGIIAPSSYNELKALHEAIHEVAHAMERQRYVTTHGSIEGFENVVGISRYDPRYAVTEVRVERTAQQRTVSLVEPRIADALQKGQQAEAARLQTLLDDLIQESDAYIANWQRRTGE